MWTPLAPKVYLTQNINAITNRCANVITSGLDNLSYSKYRCT